MAGVRQVLHQPYAHRNGATLRDTPDILALALHSACYAIKRREAVSICNDNLNACTIDNKAVNQATSFREVRRRCVPRAVQVFVERVEIHDVEIFKILQSGVS